MGKRLIGLTGLARSGKDTFARFLVEKHGFKQMAFADPVKLTAAPLFGFSYEYVFSDQFKFEVQRPWVLTGREILQKLGTEAIRGTFGDDFWIRRLIDAYLVTYAGVESVVVTDVRFENEAEAIREQGGVIVHIKRQAAGLKGAEATHSSERGVKLGGRDLVVENDGTLEELLDKASRLMIFLDVVSEKFGLMDD